jgi:hypothetical protein
MAFSEGVGGERYNLRTGNVVPKKVSAALKATIPLKWMLVKLTGSANDTIDQCAAGDTPYGIIFSVIGGLDIVSVLEFRDNTLLLEYTGSLTAGTSTVVADGSAGTILIGGFLRDRVKSGSSGLTVINKDIYATNVCLVRAS